LSWNGIPSIQGNIHDPDLDVDYFELVLPPASPGATIALQVWSTGDTDIEGALFDSDLTPNVDSPLIYSDDDGHGFNIHIIYTLDRWERVTYYVGIAGWEAGPYTLHFSINP